MARARRRIMLAAGILAAFVLALAVIALAAVESLPLLNGYRLVRNSSVGWGFQHRIEPTGGAGPRVGTDGLTTTVARVGLRDPHIVGRVDDQLTGRSSYFVLDARAHHVTAYETREDLDKGFARLTGREPPFLWPVLP